MRTPRLVLTSLLLAGVAVGVPQGPAHAAPTAHHRTVTTPVHGTVKRVVVRGDSGDVVVHRGTTHRVVAHEQWNLSRPHVTVALAKGVLTVKVRCANDGGANDCAADLDVAVPRSVDVVARTAVGAVKVTGIHGAVTLATDAGDVTATVVSESVHATSGTGDVHVNVPAGDYDYRATSDAGDARGRDLIYRQDSPRVIRAHSDAGDVLLVGTGAKPVAPGLPS